MQLTIIRGSGLTKITKQFNLNQSAGRGATGAKGDDGGGGIVPRTESEVTAALALLPVGSYILSAVVSPDPDPNPPTGESVIIDEGAAVTSLNVNLTLFATDDVGVTEMMISNDAGFSGGSWEAYATAKAWSLAAGADGIRNVYAKFRDAALNESGTATDSTTYTAGALPLAFFTDYTNSQGFIVAASSEVNTPAHAAWKSLDGDTTSGTNSSWATALNQQIGSTYELDLNGTFLELSGYKIYPQALPDDDYVTAKNRSPKGWTFEGWNGSAWVVLGTETGIINWYTTPKQFTCLGTSVSKFRWTFTEIQATSDGYLETQEFELLGL